MNKTRLHIVLLTLFIYVHGGTTTYAFMPDDLSHRDLAEELALVKRMALTEVPLGGMWRNRNSVPRADVLEIKPSYDDFLVTIYDVKRTRADFRKSVKSGKWEKYLPHCNRFCFAVMKGVAKKNEMPEGVGLLIRGEKGWYTRVVGSYRQVEIPLETMKAIMFQRVSMEVELRRKKDFMYDMSVRSECRRLGKEVNNAIRFYRTWHWQINRLKDEGLL